MTDFNEFELECCEIFKGGDCLDKKPKKLHRAKKCIVLEFKKNEWISERIRPRGDFTIHVLYDPGMTLGVYRFENLGFDFSWRDFVGKDRKVKSDLRRTFIDAVVSEHAFLKTQYDPRKCTREGVKFFTAMRRAFDKLFIEPDMRKTVSKKRTTKRHCHAH